MSTNATASVRNNRIIMLHIFRIFAVFVFVGVCYLALELGYSSSTAKTQSTTLTASESESHNGVNGEEPVEQNILSGIRDLVENLDVHGMGGLDLGMVLNIFTRRENAFLIYVGMIILIAYFGVIYDNRIRALISGERQKNKIDKYVFSEESNPTQNIEEMIKAGKVTGRYEQLIVDLYHSFQKEGNKTFFDYHFHKHLYAEEEEAGQFRVRMQRTNVWIIRMGILGTLIGLAVAFFELYTAVGSIDASEASLKISDKFVGQVQKALLGNVIAVGTSIAAHMITLMVEVLLASLILRRNNIEWIKRTYDWALAYEGFSSKEEMLSDSVRKMNLKVNGSLGYIDDLNSSIRDLTPSVGKVKTNFDIVGKESDKLAKTMDNSEKIVSDTSKTLNEVDKTSIKLDASIDQFVKTINNSEKVVGRTGKTLNGVEGSGSKLDKSINNLRDNVEKLSKSAKTNHSSMDQLEKRINTASDDLEKLRVSAIGKLHTGLKRAANIIKDTFNVKRWD